MMIDRVRRLALLMLVGCIPDFQIDALTFADAGTPRDAAELEKEAGEPDAAPLPDATDSGIHPDADPEDAEPDGGLAEDCAITGDEDMDGDFDCGDQDCDGFVGSGWQCRSGVKAETECTNNVDDDGDQEFDCHDDVDCGCALNLTCCDNGECLTLSLCGT